MTGPFDPEAFDPEVFDTPEETVIRVRGHVTEVVVTTTPLGVVITVTAER